MIVSKRLRCEGWKKAVLSLVIFFFFVLCFVACLPCSWRVIHFSFFEGTSYPFVQETTQVNQQPHNYFSWIIRPSIRSLVYDDFFVRGYAPLLEVMVMSWILHQFCHDSGHILNRNIFAILFTTSVWSNWKKCYYLRFSRPKHFIL